MITLAFDTAAKTASVALMRDDSALAEYSIESGLTQSELILPMAENMLKLSGLSFSDIGLLAVSAGPGSFTGVRIGISLVKGIALGKNTPIAAVSTLEALAENLSGVRGIIIPVMDARRGQFYTAIFRSADGELTRLTEDFADNASGILDRLSSLGISGEPIWLVGDGYAPAGAAFHSLGIKTESTPAGLISESAMSVARVGLRKYTRGELVGDTELSPIYLRLPQAERERLEREKELSK